MIVSCFRTQAEDLSDGCWALLLRLLNEQQYEPDYDYFDNDNDEAVHGYEIQAAYRQEQWSTRNMTASKSWGFSKFLCVSTIEQARVDPVASLLLCYQRYLEITWTKFGLRRVNPLEIAFSGVSRAD